LSLRTTACLFCGVTGNVSSSLFGPRNDRIPVPTRLAELLLADGCGAAGVYKHLAAADLVFCRALESGRDADVSPVSGGQAAAFLKKMKDLPSVLRTRYALALLKDGDGKKAEEIRRRFEKVALTYPAASEIESERELMDMALARAEAGPRA
jgi:hypothetical protein